MGTRNLTCVVKNGEFVVAQYGQWDGYPDGNGFKILEFLEKINLDDFNKKVENLSFYEEGDFVGDTPPRS